MESKNEGNAVNNTARSLTQENEEATKKLKKASIAKGKEVSKEKEVKKIPNASLSASAQVRTAEGEATRERVAVDNQDVVLTAVAEKKEKKTASHTVKKTASNDLTSKASKDSSEKAAAKKTTRRKAVKKKEEVPEGKTTLYVQYAGREFKQDDIIEKIQKKFVEESGKNVSAIKSLDIYVKLEEDTAYYVINKQIIGSVRL